MVERDSTVVESTGGDVPLAAMAGTVASAVQFLSKALITNTIDDLPFNLRVKENIGSIRLRLLGETGLMLPV